MSNNYDIETFRDNIVDLIQQELPQKIIEINLEKNDEFQINNISPSNYYNDIMDQVLNISPFIYYGVNNLTSFTVGCQTKVEVTLFVSVVFDNTNLEGTETKVLRYSRCLKEIIQENFKIFPSTSALSVTEFAPENYELNNGADFKVGGIHITATITG